jgi:nucleoid-associated protein YgaU
VAAAPVETPATAPAVTTTPTVAEKPVGTVVHTVKKGETLGHIARQYYGKSSQWKRILDANRDVLPSESKLQPGMKLKVPR